MGLINMGHQAMETLVLPNVPIVTGHLAVSLEKALDSESHLDIQKLEGALQLACTLCANAMLDQRSQCSFGL